MRAAPARRGGLMGAARVGGLMGAARVGGLMGAARVGGLMGAARVGGLVVTALALACSTVAGCAAPPAAGSTPGAPAAADPAATGTVRVAVTFYAGLDNDPPGSSEIAHPNARHATAGGVGTFADPITLATDPDELPIGTVVYYPRLRKYFVMEDECDTCITEWKADRHGHLDLWTSTTTDQGVLACEEALTPDGPVPVEINPPADRPVDPRPLYDDATGRCWPGT